MAVITQEYDIDLKATGAFPVVKCSQFDTGSRKIVFTVFDGWDLADISGCLARVDGTRSDGVEFSQSCTVTDDSKVSFTITQEMTKSAGKHSAELVLFDASGNPIGTQNFMIEVEAATMRRDSAVSADDRTLYDQYTQSLEQRFDDLSASVTKTADDISALVGASSKPITVFDEDVTIGKIITNTVHVRLTYDPVTALTTAHACGTATINIGDPSEFDLHQIDSKYAPAEEFFTDTVGDTAAYTVATDNLQEVIPGDSKHSNYQMYYIGNDNGVYKLRFYLGFGTPDHEGTYQVSLNASWYARGGKYMGVTPLPGGGGTGGSGYVLPPATAVTLGGVKVGKGLAVTDDGTLSSDHSGAGTDSIAIGEGAKSTGSRSIALGKNSNASGASSVALGGGSASGSESLAVFSGAKAVGGESIAIGMNSSASRDYNVAVGNVAVAKGGTSTAIGYKCYANADDSVAVGYGSTTDESNTFAVGSPSQLRRVVNVKEPLKDSDAATKAYVDALIAKIKSDNNLK